MVVSRLSSEAAGLLFASPQLQDDFGFWPLPSGFGLGLAMAMTHTACSLVQFFSNLPALFVNFHRPSLRVGDLTNRRPQCGVCATNFGSPLASCSSLPFPLRGPQPA